MIALGLYKKEFDSAIERYSDYLEQYDILTARWRRERYRVYVKTIGEAPSKRNPLCVAIESLRKDMVTLESALGLLPQGLQRMDGAAFTRKKVSKIAEALRDAGEG